MNRKKDEIRELIEVTLCALMIFGIIDYFNYTDLAQFLQKGDHTRFPGVLFPFRGSRMSKMKRESQTSFLKTHCLG